MLRTSNRTLSLLVLAYIASGWLALLVALTPGYVSPLFPPAGIALAAALVFGRRAILPLYAAAVIVQALAQLHSGAPHLELGLVILGGLGPVLQALGGAWLMGRLRAWPSGIDTTRAAWGFVCIAAPLGCLISPTLSLPVMLAVGAGDGATTLAGWITWWIGDTLGVLLFTPIGLALIGEPARDWHGRHRGITVPLLVVAVVLAAALLLVRQREESSIANKFERDADHLASALISRLTTQMDALTAVERFAALSPHLDRTDWSRITQPWLQRYPGARNLIWSPLVRRAERSEFEAAQQASGQTGFHIMDRDAAGHLRPAAAAEEYLPATFVAPTAGNRQVLGMNPLSLASLLPAIRKTRETGYPAVTDAVRLVQATESEQSVVIYQAVFTRDGDPASPLRGVVSMALQLDSFLRFANARLHADQIELCVADRSNPTARQRLLGPPGCSNPGWLERHRVLTRQLAFADRQWQFLLRADDHYATAPFSWVSSATLGTALVFAGMISAFLLQISGRARRIEEQVTQRTAELAHATAQLRDQKASLAQAQRIARMGSWEIGNGANYLHCSEEFRHLLDLPASGRILLHDVLLKLTAPGREQLDAAIQNASLAPGTLELDCTLEKPATPAEILHFQIESEWLLGRLLRVFGTVQNVTSTREAEAHIQYLARFDALTGLPNRSYWQDLARTTLGTARRHHDQAAVLFLDLDHFKTINDSLGHAAGDQLLMAVATRLKRCVRAEDLLARQGGDEFVLLLPRLVNVDEVTTVALKLVKGLAEPFQIQGHDLSVSVSIGIAHYPSDGEDIDTLLKHADVAMYSAKQAGRNSYRFFVPEMNQRALTRLQMENALRRALERGELILHYQPQLDLPSGRIDACEALVRWQHPEQGMIPPIEFIPLAEESGLILPIGDWVLREACAQQARWAAVGLNLGVAINISALQFQQPDFSRNVAKVLAETGADPHFIELEITESALLDSTEELVKHLETLRALGVSLSLDDFGTGYSCLAYLKRLPIKRLKIDRSFVKDLPGDAEDGAIASATLSMARDLGMEVVAEGVENAAQLDYLMARQCRSIQGYFISRPLPVDELMRWLAQREGRSAP